MLNGPIQNTDREIWRSSHKLGETPDARVAVTHDGRIRIGYYDKVWQKTPAEWLEAALFETKVGAKLRHLPRWRTALAKWLLDL